MIKKKMHKKDFERLTKPSRSGRPEGRPAETGSIYSRKIFVRTPIT